MFSRHLVKIGNGCLWAALVILFLGRSFAQMPDRPGRAETEKLCSGCHELERSVSLRQDRDGWRATINRMVNFGAEATEAEFTAVLEYLAANYPQAGLPPLNVNTARAIDFEARLNLKRSQAAAIIEYRTKHGKISSIEELKKAPGVEAAKIDAKKDILVF